MVRKNEYCMGGKEDSTYGADIAAVMDVICDECGAEMASGDVMYEYEKNKWCCEDCLLELFPSRIAQDFIDDYERAELLGDNPMGEDQEQLEYLRA